MTTPANTAPRPAHGLGHFFKRVVHTTVDVGKGVGDAAVDQGKGAVALVKHPKRSVEGIGMLVAHPARTLEALGTDQPGGTGRSDSTARQVGHAVGGLGLDVLSLGGGAVASAAGTASTVAGATRSADEVSRAGLDGKADGPIHFGGVTKGAAKAFTRPARDTLHAATHPGDTLSGLHDAARHPLDTADHVDDQDRNPPAADASERMGRGIVRLGEMAIGVAPGPVRQFKDATDAGQSVDKAAKAGKSAR